MSSVDFKECLNAQLVCFFWGGGGGGDEKIWLMAYYVLLCVWQSLLENEHYSATYLIASRLSKCYVYISELPLRAGLIPDA